MPRQNRRITRSSSWRALGVAFAVLFLVGFIFGEGDWFGLEARSGWAARLALRIARGLASALLAPLVIGIPALLQHFIVVKPFKEATRTRPATPGADADPIRAARQPRPTGRRRLLLGLRRLLIGFVLFLAPIYAVMGLLALVDVDTDTGVSVGLLVTIAGWGTVGWFRRARERAEERTRLRFLLIIGTAEDTADYFSCVKIADAPDHPRGVVVRATPPIPEPGGDHLDDLVAVWPATTGTTLDSLEAGGVVEVMVGPAPGAPRYTTRPWYHAAAVSFADLALEAADPDDEPER